MASISGVSIDKHTTASDPRPHILYVIQVNLSDGTNREVLRRYSDFVSLHQTLEDPYVLPPKRLLVNAFSPSAWIDDQLINERKIGLTAYLTSLLQGPPYQSNPALLDFLSPEPCVESGQIDFEDALPSMSFNDTGVTISTGVLEPDVSSFVAAAYYPTWCNNAPESINYAKFDIIFFAFAIPNSSSTLDLDSGCQSLLHRLVQCAHKSGKGTKIVLSVGGWGGCEYYTQATSSQNRTKFCNALVDAVKTYNLDGIDIDWEYPNSSGSGHPHSPSDASNLLSLIKALRAALGSSKIISAAVPHLPWLGSNGQPLTNVSEYAENMTYVNIMNYDVNASSPNPGPNAPLGNPCGTSKQPHANAQAGVAQWKAAGFPASKILLGLPLYGYVSNSKATKMSDSLITPPQSKVGFASHRQPDAFVTESSALSREAGDISHVWGQQFGFNQLVTSGALKKQADGTYVGANGYTMGWDDCADVPFLYNVARSTFVSYDDTWSLGDKATFAKGAKLGGCFTWSMDQDDGVALQDVIRKSLGK